MLNLLICCPSRARSSSASSISWVTLSPAISIPSYLPRHVSRRTQTAGRRERTFDALHSIWAVGYECPDLEIDLVTPWPCTKDVSGSPTTWKQSAQLFQPRGRFFPPMHQNAEMLGLSACVDVDSLGGGRGGIGREVTAYLLQKGGHCEV